MKTTSTFLHSLVTIETWNSFEKMTPTEQQIMEIFALATLSVFQPEKVTIEYQTIQKNDGTTECCYTIKTTLEENSDEHASSL